MKKVSLSVDICYFLVRKSFIRFVFVYIRHRRMLKQALSFKLNLWQVVGNGSVVEHWSSNPEDAGSIPSRKALELYFSQLVPVSVL